MNITNFLSSLDETRKAKLIAAEKAWIAYRDAQGDFEADAVARGGTMYLSIYNEVRATLTELRIKGLKKAISQ